MRQIFLAALTVLLAEMGLCKQLSSPTETTSKLAAGHPLRHPWPRDFVVDPFYGRHWYSPCYPFVSCAAYRRYERRQELRSRPPRDTPSTGIETWGGLRLNEQSKVPRSEVQPEYAASGQIRPEYETTGEFLPEFLDQRGRSK